MSPLHPNPGPECTSEGRRGVCRRRDGRGDEVQERLPPGNHIDTNFKFPLCFLKNTLEGEFPSGPGLEFCSSTVQDTGYIPDLGNKMPRPRKERIKWGKHNLILRMNVKRKTVGRGPLETLFSHQGPIRTQLIQNQVPEPGPEQKRGRCFPLVVPSVTAQV